MNEYIQTLIVFLAGIGCIVLAGIRIYRTINAGARSKSPCDGCATGCDLQRALKEKQGNCEKNARKSKKSHSG